VEALLQQENAILSLEIILDNGNPALMSLAAANKCKTLLGNHS
jgi:hypothetical protein